MSRERLEEHMNAQKAIIEEASVKKFLSARTENYIIVQLAKLKNFADNPLLEQDILRCPISFEPYNIPVITSDGKTYDLESIMRWFQKGKITSPVTGEPLSSQLLTPNQSIAIQMNQIIDQITQKPESKANSSSSLVEP